MAEVDEATIKRALEERRAARRRRSRLGWHGSGIAVMDGEVYFAIEIDPAQRRRVRAGARRGREGR